MVLKELFWVHLPCCVGSIYRQLYPPLFSGPADQDGKSRVGQPWLGNCVSYEPVHLGLGFCRGTTGSDPFSQPLSSDAEHGEFEAIIQAEI